MLLGTVMLIGVFALIGCASPHSVTTLNTVSPEPAVSIQKEIVKGSLKVYTATGEYTDGDYIYHPHSGYTIYHNDGTVCKRVLNHAGMDDNNAEVIGLPPGRYIVSADSEMNGLVKVPVVIMGGKLTVVNLERRPVTELDKPGVELAYPES